MHHLPPLFLLTSILSSFLRPSSPPLPFPLLVRLELAGKEHEDILTSDAKEGVERIRRLLKQGGYKLIASGNQAGKLKFYFFSPQEGGKPEVLVELTVHKVAGKVRADVQFRSREGVVSGAQKRLAGCLVEMFVN